MSEYIRHAGAAGASSERTQHRLDCAFFLDPETVAASALSACATLTDLTGLWQTEVRIFQHPVHLSFCITASAGYISATFSCPEAGLEDMPVQETCLHRDIVRIEMDDFDSRFSGILNPLTQQIEGLFSHGGFRFAATLTRP